MRAIPQNCARRNSLMRFQEMLGYDTWRFDYALFFGAGR